ncbi:hypothetical protein D3C86_1684750 [compost metagenome]
MRIDNAAKNTPNSPPIVSVGFDKLIVPENTVAPNALSDIVIVTALGSISNSKLKPGIKRTGIQR